MLTESKAFISVNNRSFRYGDGCFETLKVINGKINLLDFHLERLFFSIHFLQFVYPSYFTKSYVAKSILDLVNANVHQNLARVRLTIFANDGGLYDSDNRILNYVVQSWSLNEANNQPSENGLVIGTYPNGIKAADSLSNIKSNNFLLYSMAALYAKRQKWNDALVHNHHGNICDATIANLFIVKGKKIITPRLSDGPVDGTMRRFLLENLPKLGFSVSEELVTPPMLQDADECFLSNSIYGIKWVKEHSDRQYGNENFFHIYREIILPLWKY